MKSKKRVMVEIRIDDNNIFMVASGKLDDKDYDEMLPLIKKKIDEFGVINWYFQMKDFKGWTLHAFWRDLKFDLGNMRKLGRVAMVGNKKWEEVMTGLMDSLTHADIRYFDEGNAQEAKSWIAGQ